MILPLGPDPLPMVDKSRPFSDANLLANGDANNLPPTPLGLVDIGAGGGDDDEGVVAAMGGGGGLDLGGALAAVFTSIGPAGPT